MKTNSLAGKTVLITGATNGIGKATALELARAGAQTLIVGRDAFKTERCRAEIADLSGNRNVKALIADLSIRSAIDHLAAQVRDGWSTLDVLINNAGGMQPRQLLSVDGVELTFAINHLAYFQLTVALYPLLAAAPSARIINVTTDWHKKGTIDWSNLQGEKSWDSAALYYDTKLANVLFTYELARRLRHTSITANCVHPGAVQSGFWEGQPGAMAKFFRFMSPLMFLSPQKGAEPLVHLATSPDLKGSSGEYFSRMKKVRSAPSSYDEHTQARLWEVSAELLGLAPDPDNPLAPTAKDRSSSQAATSG
ncbi:MAG: SDR family oxidoreductase [Myxococcota bacterium]